MIHLRRYIPRKCQVKIGTLHLKPIAIARLAHHTVGRKHLQLEKVESRICIYIPTHANKGVIALLVTSLSPDSL